MNNKDKGNLGENLASDYLQSLGYKVLERNWRYSRFGEIDIIALDKDTLVFVEVKARRSVAFGHPFEAINEKKVQQVRAIAQAYMAQDNCKYKKCRLDGVSVILSTQPKIEHLKNIF